MNEASIQSKSAQPVRMNIQGTDAQVTVLEEQSLSGPQGNHEVLVTIAKAKLTDTSNGQIYTGLINLQIKGANVTPTFFPVITRMLIPFKGDFLMNVSGTILSQTSQYVTVQVDDIVSIRIIPA